MTTVRAKSMCFNYITWFASTCRPVLKMLTWTLGTFSRTATPKRSEKIPISPIACIGIPGDSAINEANLEPLVDLMIANLNADTAFATQGAY